MARASGTFLGTMVPVFRDACGWHNVPRILRIAGAGSELFCDASFNMATAWLVHLSEGSTLLLPFWARVNAAAPLLGERLCVSGVHLGAGTHRTLLAWLYRTLLACAPLGSPATKGVLLA